MCELPGQQGIILYKRILYSVNDLVKQIFCSTEVSENGEWVNKLTTGYPCVSVAITHLVACKIMP